jgi:hypothetical protein
MIIHATVAFGTPTNVASRGAFFKGAKYVIGGLEFSSQDIEDGVLRGNSPAAASLGTLLGFPALSSGPFSSSDPRRRYAMTPMDPRIHFALVCGAKSCPAIRVFGAGNLEEGLRAAAEAFCEGEVEIDVANRAVSMNKILWWYRFDFGGNQRERLERVRGYLPEGGEGRRRLAALLAEGDPETLLLSFREYDWGVNGSSTPSSS